MKKQIFLFLFLISFLNLTTTTSKAMLDSSEEKQTEEIDADVVEKLTEQLSKLGEVIQQDDSIAQSQLSRKQKVYNKLVFVASKVKNTFNWVVDHIDGILSKKGVIKTLLILGPLFTLYCVFFPPEPVKFLIAKIFSWSTQGAVEIGTSAGKGMVEGALIGVKENWWQVLEISLLTSVGATAIMMPVTIIKVAIPAITTILLKRIRLL